MIDRATPSAPPENPAPSPTHPAQHMGEQFDLDAAGTLPGGVPAMPPTEVLVALDRAQSVIAEFASRQVSMRISVEDWTDSKIRVALYDREGKLIREVPAAHATAMLSGERPVGRTDA